ncbi:hypothetical protein RKD18_005548 [Streptomyces phaeoluteigriseus]
MRAGLRCPGCGRGDGGRGWGGSVGVSVGQGLHEGVEGVDRGVVGGGGYPGRFADGGERPVGRRLSRPGTLRRADGCAVCGDGCAAGLRTGGETGRRLSRLRRPRAPRGSTGVSWAGVGMRAGSRTEGRGQSASQSATGSARGPAGLGPPRVPVRDGGSARVPVNVAAVDGAAAVSASGFITRADEVVSAATATATAEGEGEGEVVAGGDGSGSEAGTEGHREPDHPVRTRRPTTPLRRPPAVDQPAHETDELGGIEGLGKKSVDARFDTGFDLVLRTGADDGEGKVVSAGVGTQSGGGPQAVQTGHDHV